MALRCRIVQGGGTQPDRGGRGDLVRVTTVTVLTDRTCSAAEMVSSSMASTSCSRHSADNTGASRVLAALSCLTAMISPARTGLPDCLPLI